MTAWTLPATVLTCPVTCACEGEGAAGRLKWHQHVDAPTPEPKRYRAPLMALSGRARRSEEVRSALSRGAAEALPSPCRSGRSHRGGRSRPLDHLTREDAEQTAADDRARRARAQFADIHYPCPTLTTVAKTPAHRPSTRCSLHHLMHGDEGTGGLAPRASRATQVMQTTKGSAHAAEGQSHPDDLHIRPLSIPERSSTHPCRYRRSDRTPGG